MKCFLSQLMRDRTHDDIMAEREEYIRALREKYPDVEVIDSYNPGEGSPVYKLGVAIQQLSEADAIAFLPRALTEGRGTLVEYAVARLYGIPIIDTYKEK